MTSIIKRNVIGVDISVLDYPKAVQKILSCAHTRCRCTTTALAVHGLISGALDDSHRFRLNAFDLVVPDGQPVRWALNLLYNTNLKDRVYGPKLTLLVCKEAAKLDIPVFFYGSRSLVLESLCRQLQDLCPGLKIAGTLPSEFRRLNIAERGAIVRRIKKSGAQILFVGLGCPRQEVFTYEMGAHLAMPILAVGAAFDYHAGVLKEPPELIQQIGLQWLYRLLQEPRRLWRRYLITNSQFLALLLLQWLRLWDPKQKEAKAPTAEVLYG